MWASTRAKSTRGPMQGRRRTCSHERTQRQARGPHTATLDAGSGRVRCGVRRGDVVVDRAEVPVKRKKVVRIKDLPTRTPTLLAAVVWLYMDRFNAPGWLHGIVWTLLGVWWIAAVITVFWVDDEWPVQYRDKEPGE